MSKKNNTTTPTPHDAAFRSFLANPDVARDFLELHLPAEYRQLCDLSTLKLEPATFVEPDLHQYASDILWSVKTTGGEDGYVYTLIEHQSTRAPEHRKSVHAFSHVTLQCGGDAETSGAAQNIATGHSGAVLSR